MTKCVTQGVGTMPPTDDPPCSAAGVAVVLLAAGQSRRFGADKLAWPLDGVPLAHHVAAQLTALAPLVRFAVVPPGVAPPPGFAAVVNDRPAGGMGRSVALGAAAARAAGASAVLIALADMPRVSRTHLRRLLARHRGPSTLLATSDGARRMPPALFGADWFATLERLEGDAGARRLLGGAELVLADPTELVDIDVPADLARLGGRPGHGA